MLGKRFGVICGTIVVLGVMSAPVLAQQERSPAWAGDKLLGAEVSGALWTADGRSIQATLEMRVEGGPCFNNEDCVNVEVWVTDPIAPDQEINGAQFFIRYADTCVYLGARTQGPAFNVWDVTVDEVVVVAGTNGFSELHYAVNRFFDLPQGETLIATIPVCPVDGITTCTPDLRFIPSAPGFLHTKVSVPQGDGAFEYPDELALNPDVGQTLGISFDLEDPVITCPPDDTVEAEFPFDCEGIGCAAYVDPGFATATDGGVPIDPSEITWTRSDGKTSLTDPYCVGDTTITWCVEDACGNEACCDQIITVVDTVPPEIVCPPDITTNADANTCGVYLDPGWAECTDSCPCFISPCRDDGLLGLDDLYPVGTTCIEWRAWDGNNFVSCTQCVTVVDDTDPWFGDFPVDITADAGANCTAEVCWDEPVCDDNCPGCTVWCDHGAPGNPCDTFNIGTNSVCCTVTDASSNSVTECFNVFVVDDIPPELHLPGNITTDADMNTCGADVCPPPATCTDNCGCSVDCVRGDGGDVCGWYGVGTTTITCTATDESSNSVEGSYTVTVQDVQDPWFSDFPNDITTKAGEDCNAYVCWDEPVCDDNCPGCTVDCNSCGVFEIGTNSVCCTATDASNNSVTKCFKVVVEDHMGPDVTCPDDVNTNNEPSECYASPDLGTPGCSDNCDDPDDCSTNCFAVRDDGLDVDAPYPVGETTVTWCCTDDVLNETCCEQTVVVVDNEDPDCTAPPDLHVYAGLGDCCVYVDVDPDGVAACADNCCVDCPPIPIRHDSLSITDCFSHGVTIIDWICMDNDGNQSSCSQTITVEHGFWVNVELRGGADGFYVAGDRPITFELFDCQGDGAPVLVLCQDMYFDAWGTTGDVFIEVDPQEYPEVCGVEFTCLTTRNTYHTLRRTIEVPDGWDWSADVFEFTLANDKELIPGNLDDNCVIDVADFGILVSLYPGTSVPPAYCGLVGYNADINGNGEIDVAVGDPQAILLNFWAIAEMNCCSYDDDGNPGTDWSLCDPGRVTASASVTVEKLRGMGVVQPERIDFNGNGLFDLADVAAFMAGTRPDAPTAGNKAKAKKIELELRREAVRKGVLESKLRD
ncbi:MAG: HYR domain-containing protein [Phycisphaerae bacterium]|nr:HYR domain-containing protein [Phycisphaerae bacterium]